MAVCVFVCVPMRIMSALRRKEHACAVEPTVPDCMHLRRSMCVCVHVCVFAYSAVLRALALVCC